MIHTPVPFPQQSSIPSHPIPSRVTNQILLMRAENKSLCLSWIFCINLLLSSLMSSAHMLPHGSVSLTTLQLLLWSSPHAWYLSWTSWVTTELLISAVHPLQWTCIRRETFQRYDTEWIRFGGQGWQPRESSEHFQCKELIRRGISMISFSRTSGPQYILMDTMHWRADKMISMMLTKMQS